MNGSVSQNNKFEYLLEGMQKIESVVNLGMSIMPQFQAVLTFSKDILPVWKELFTFIQEVLPLMREIQGSIQESRQKMPMATQKLDVITKETELATLNIMNKVDELNEDADFSQTKLDQIKTSIQNFEQDEKLVDVFSYLEQEKSEHADALKNFLGNLQTAIEELYDKNSAVINGLFEIMTNLQFQDITTQQIQHANDILEKIDHKFHEILVTMGEDVQFRQYKKRVFDDKASIQRGEERQRMADELASQVEQEKEAVVSEDEVDQAAIDALLNAGVTEDQGETVSAEDNETFSQDDIEKLFNQNKDN